ncbi:MAG TPA: outer membrane lipoprotein-sorting protein [Aliidongia sp.]|uniref:outer membrane lipoprotein-sorting protein n=1 Tax=Aliidongia sp. TaxID=1914230 RepID=UPI002DDD1F2F|nr:outer membrane lipoprotein-sorting protein [Aliidongia sp.]HEV2678701.1 outer membrane lipoprotein-sorting protein [Aliidongia sp.]
MSKTTTMRAVAAVFLAFAATNDAARAETAQDIVVASDKVRNPGEPFRSTNTLTEFVAGKPRDQNVLVVYAKEDPATHQFRNLIRYVAPPRDQGKMVLLDGRVLWFYDPNSKASVRISPQQRLIGQAAIGDVLTVNFAVDYSGTLLGDETIQDASRKDRQCWHLDMKAANDQAVYNRVEYWVEHGTNYPVKAKFYSDSGRLLKILYYRGFEEQLGRIRPTEAVIIDAVDTSLVTTFKFGDFHAQAIPDAWFQRDYLPRLQPE